METLGNDAEGRYAQGVQGSDDVILVDGSAEPLVTFHQVRAFRYLAESHCTGWHVEPAYGALVEVVGSQWAAELRDADHAEPPWQIRHFMVYIDGCYEVAATGASIGDSTY